MKPIIPANSTSFALRTVARGMFPMEPMKVKKATTGPINVCWRMALKPGLAAWAEADPKNRAV